MRPEKGAVSELSRAGRRRDKVPIALLSTTPITPGLHSHRSKKIQFLQTGFSLIYSICPRKCLDYISWFVFLLPCLTFCLTHFPNPTGPAFDGHCSSEVSLGYAPRLQFVLTLGLQLILAALGNNQHNPSLAAVSAVLPGNHRQTGKVHSLLE